MNASENDESAACERGGDAIPGICSERKRKSEETRCPLRQVRIHAIRVHAHGGERTIVTRPVYEQPVALVDVEKEVIRPVPRPDRR